MVTLLGMSLGKCILVDDILNTGQTLATAAEVLMKNAQEVLRLAWFVIRSKTN